MIDARGFTCPMPVAMVQKEVKKNASRRYIEFQMYAVVLG